MWLCLSISFLLFNSIHGFITGAPESACSDQSPQHVVSSSAGVFAAQLPSTNGYVVNITDELTNAGVSYTYTPGTAASIYVGSNSVYGFRGFMVSASDIRGSRMGSFDPSWLPSGAKLLCNGTAVTHTDNLIKNSLLLRWSPPSTGGAGPVSVNLTLVETSTRWFKLNLWAFQSSVVVAPERPSPPVVALDSSGFPLKGSDWIVVSWSSVAGGSGPVLNYTLQFNSAVENGQFLLLVESAELRFNASALQPNSTYRFRVRANNALTAGPYSDDVTVSSYPLPERPATPSPPRLVDSTSTSLVVSWDLPDLRGFPLVRSILRRHPSRSAPVDDAQVVFDGTSLEYNVTGLAANTTYYFTLQIVSTVGASGVSAVSALSTEMETLPPNKCNSTHTDSIDYVSSDVHYCRCKSGWISPDCSLAAPLSECLPLSNNSPSLCIEWTYDEQSVYVQVTAQTLGWVGLLVGSSSMVGSDAWLMYIRRDILTNRFSVIVNDSSSTSYSQPLFDPVNTVEDISGYETSQSTVIFFRRKHIPSDEESPAVPNAVLINSFIRMGWAMAASDPETAVAPGTNDSLTLFSNHTKFGTFVLNWLAPTPGLPLIDGPPVEEDVYQFRRWILLTHAIGMMVAWMGVGQLTSWMAFLVSRHYGLRTEYFVEDTRPWYILYLVFQTCCWVGTVVLVLFAVYWRSQAPGGFVVEAHGISGFVLLGLVATVGGVGIYSRCSKVSRNIEYSSLSHRWLGRAILVMLLAWQLPSGAWLFWDALGLGLTIFGSVCWVAVYATTWKLTEKFQKPAQYEMNEGPASPSAVSVAKIPPISAAHYLQTPKVTLAIPQHEARREMRDDPDRSLNTIAGLSPRDKASLHLRSRAHGSDFASAAQAIAASGEGGEQVEFHVEAEPHRGPPPGPPPASAFADRDVHEI